MNFPHDALFRLDCGADWKKASLVNLRQLKYFVAVVAAGNMTRAADQLHVAQPALGMQIRQMEEELGVSLLVRHSRGVELTEAGHLLYPRAIQILNLVEETRKQIVAFGGRQNETIRFGITPALMLMIGAELAMTVREQYPQISFQMAEAMSHVLIETLSRGEIDFILSYDVPETSQISKIDLLHDDLVLVTKPGQHEGKAIAFVEAIDQPLAMPERGDGVRDLVERTAADLGLELKVDYEVRSIAAMKNLALRGAAACILPSYSLIEEVQSGKLSAWTVITPPLRRTLSLAFLTKKGPYRNEVALTNAVRISLETLIKAAGPLSHPLW